MELILTYLLTYEVAHCTCPYHLRRRVRRTAVISSRSRMIDLLPAAVCGCRLLGLQTGRRVLSLRHDTSGVYGSVRGAYKLVVGYCL